MKTYFLFLYGLLVCNVLFSQNTLLYSPITSGHNIITDALEKNDTLFTLQVDLGAKYASKLVLLNTVNGGIISSFSLGDFSFLAARIIYIENDILYLLGRLQTDTCFSIVVSASYNLNSYAFEIISEIPFCHNNSIQNLRISNDLIDGWLINGYWIANGYNRFVIKMNTNLQLKLIKDSIVVKMASVDFSRKGYVIKDESFCLFYDKDFNFRKDRYSINEGINNIHQTHLPYGDYFLLESFSGAPNFENKGHYVRIVDSLLRVQKLLYIAPGTKDFIGGFEPPFFGGIDFIDSTSFWMAGNNNLTSNIQSPTHFSITRVNENLEIDCNQYLGFDAHYRIYGINSTAEGGVIVYGMKINETYDPFLIILGPNCELPTVSTNGTESPLISVSVYPNPGINEVSFAIQGFDATTLRMELINAQGQVLFGANDLSNRIEVADLPAGQYFYRILQKDRLLGVGGWVKE